MTKLKWARSQADGLLALLCTAVFSLSVWQYWIYVNDDAFISFRYAANLLAGHGLTYNPGERLEGYTNFLWVILSVPFLQLGGEEDLLVTMKFVGAGFGLGTIALTYFCGRHLFKSHAAALVAPLLLAVSPPFCLNAVSGLETMLFTFLVTLALLLRLAGDERRDVGFALAMALASLTRPEGFGLFAILMTFQLVRGVALRRLLWMGGAYAVVVMPFLGWKLAYYGALLPNTFYAKPGTVAGGWHYVRSFLTLAGLTKLFGLPLLSLVAGVLRLRRASGWPALVLFTLVLAAVVSGGDWMLGWRFIVPALPAGFLVIAAGMDGFSTRLEEWRPRTGLAAIVVTSALLLFALDLPRLHLSSEARARGEGQQAAHLEISHWLRGHAARGDTIALMDIGMIGFLSGLKVIDITGLTDAYIGRSPGPMLGKQYDSSYVLDQRPEYIVLVSKEELHLQGRSDALLSPSDLNALWFQDRRIARHPSFARDYEPVLTRFASFEGYLNLFRRRAVARQGI